MATIEACIDVKVPVQTAYDQWKQFEKCPSSIIEGIEGVKEGTSMNTSRLHWNTEIIGKGVVTFQPISDVMSTVVLQLAYTPEHIADGVEGSSVRVQNELKRFKAFVESCHQETGNWLTSLPYHAFP